MSLKNPLGDLELTDPKAMRALAHPTRLAILTRLQRHGADTATGLAPHVGATPSVVSWHLRHLAGFGLVAEAESPDRRQRFWKAAAHGFRFTMPDDEEGRTASRMLRQSMDDDNLTQLREFLADRIHRLEPAWERVAGASNTRVEVTPAEAEAIQDGIEALLAPYVGRRDGAATPDGARSVRFLRYTMPQPGDSSDD